MKSNIRPLLSLFNAGLAGLLFAVAPLRADDMMAQPSQPVQLSHLHYLTGKKPNAIALLARHRRCRIRQNRPPT